MALTGLQVYLDPPTARGTVLPFDDVIEYSRNERGYEIVKLYVIPDPNDGTLAGEEIKIQLFKARRDRTETVSQAEVIFTFSGSVDPNGQLFTWDLRDVLYDNAKNAFPVIRSGYYFFRVTHSGGTTGPSNVSADTDEFRVTLLTTDRLEEQWLLGVTRRSNDDRSVRFQPKTLTGVRVIEVSRGHPLDLIPLSLVKDGAGTPNYYLSWDNGQLVKIDTSIPGGIQTQYVLPGRTRDDYIIAQVDPRLLPTRNTTEVMLIDRALMSRESLRRWIDNTQEWFERTYLYTPLEPSICVSDLDLSGLDSPGAAPLGNNSDYDFLGPPITYFPPHPGHWISLDVPFGYSLKWDYLEGALESSRVVSVNTDWIHRGIGRHIDLVPFNQSLAYHFIGLFYVNAIHGPVELPSFWRYRYWAGIPDRETPGNVVEALAMKSAIKALTVLGQMFRGGFSSQSISRDGVSESVSYTSSAMYGIYSATINQLEKDLDSHLIQLKRKYFGLPTIVL